jgi:aspartyl-tRNA(Asn)/glutamyl-tRNA(Gln) amidotransferase subunit A
VATTCYSWDMIRCERRIAIVTEAAKDAIAFLSVAELLARYRRKDLSPVEMVRAVLDQVDRHNGVVNAYCHLDLAGIWKSARHPGA